MWICDWLRRQNGWHLAVLAYAWAVLLVIAAGRAHADPLTFVVPCASPKLARPHDPLQPGQEYTDLTVTCPGQAAPVLVLKGCRSPTTRRVGEQLTINCAEWRPGGDPANRISGLGTGDASIRPG